jgi:hypothetical protein
MHMCVYGCVLQRMALVEYSTGQSPGLAGPGLAGSLSGSLVRCVMRNSIHIHGHMHTCVRACSTSGPPHQGTVTKPLHGRGCDHGSERGLFSVSGQRETVWRMISLLTYGNARHCQDPRIAGVDRTDREMRSFSQNETHNEKRSFLPGPRSEANRKRLHIRSGLHVP